MASAAILIGGDATRFGGRDKSALVVDGQSILARLIGQLSPICDDILLVGGRPGIRRETYGARSIADRIAGSGPLGGLHAALAEARDAPLLLLACDMPFVTGAFLAHLLNLSQHVDAVVPRMDRRYHPLCAVYTAGCHPAVERRLSAGSFSMMGLLDDLRIRVVEAAEIATFGHPDHLLANVNTPEEYERIVKRERHKV